jgi:DNA helicase-2/ATP-dependent DNA helicase PcrA
VTRADEQTRRRRLAWTTTPPVRGQLRRDGYHVVHFQRLRAAILRARTVGSVRSSLANPAARVLSIFARHARIAVLDVSCRTVEDLALLHGYVVEPAFRHDCTLLIHADAALDKLTDGAFIDQDWRYAWTLERLRWLAGLYEVPTDRPCPASVNRWRLRFPWVSRRVDSSSRLDPEQLAAVRAGDGVVQVIAPAGSGKTTVLIARVKELLGRGTSAERILCTTFNKDAVSEMSARLAREGVDGVVVRSFHSLGLWLLKEERCLRARIGSPTFAQWRLLARRAMEAEPDGVWIDAPAAQNAVSDFKLSRMITPAVALASATDARERTVAHLFAFHEQLLAEQGLLDFDDLIAHAVALLRVDASVRRRWQARFERVLVDEYQDIEPAQALLVGLLAAPQDSLFCVGDEDQCIYAWRRATVQRVIELDQVYPGLERFPLVRNYRCGKTITTASRRLIEHNTQRFRKPLRSGTTHRGEVVAWAERDRAACAALAAEWLREAARGKVVILARTTTLLREVALACASRGIAFDAPQKAVSSSGARGTLEAYLRLLADPREAAAADVELVFRVPNRSLPQDTAETVAAGLRAGASFGQALAGLRVEPWRRTKLAEAGAFLDALAKESAADHLIARLRSDGGLDQHYALQERMSETERVDVEVLELVHAAAREKTVRHLAGLLGAQTLALRTYRSDTAVELTTIHGAKGREWDCVILYGADEGQLPHAHSMADAEDGIEDERRLCYVALTRARERLDIVSTLGRPSRFLREAGLD